MTTTGWDLAVEGMERSFDAAPEEWKAAALEAVFEAAREMEEFIADDVWVRFPAGFTKWDGNALGHVMRQGKAAGWMWNTGRTRRSERPEAHCKPERIWRSLLYGQRL